MRSKEALDIINEALEQPDNSVIFKHTGLNELKKALEEAQKQERLLELYDKLAVYRLIVINALLDEVMDLTVFDTTKEFIDYIKYQAKHYGNEDTKIVEEIAKVLKTPFSER